MKLNPLTEENNIYHLENALLIYEVNASLLQMQTALPAP